MKFAQTVIKINALFMLAAGIAFGLYGPLMMAFFAVPELLDANPGAYWQIAAFARMFGAALFGFGLLLWSLRTTFVELSARGQRGLLAALILANLMGAFISITEQSSIWGTPAGWVTTGLYSALMLANIYAIVRLPSRKSENIEEKENLTQNL